MKDKIRYEVYREVYILQEDKHVWFDIALNIESLETARKLVNELKQESHGRYRIVRRVETFTIIEETE